MKRIARHRVIAATGTVLLSVTPAVAHTAPGELLYPDGCNHAVPGYPPQVGIYAANPLPANYDAALNGAIFSWNAPDSDGPNYFNAGNVPTSVRILFADLGPDGLAGYVPIGTQGGPDCGSGGGIGWQGESRIHINTWTIEHAYAYEGLYYADPASHKAKKTVGLVAHEMGHTAGLKDDREHYDNWKSVGCDANVWGLMGFPYSYNHPEAPYSASCSWKAPQATEIAAIDIRY